MQTSIVILILLASALLFSYTYAFDLPQALQLPLRQAPFNYTNLQFNLLYFFQFLPDILFQIPIGILVDKFPLKRTMYFFAVLIFIAVLTSAFAFEFMFPGYKWVINICRSLFGVGGEALFTVQAVLLTLHAGQHYEVSMGICMCLPFICDAINSVVTTHVYDYTKNIALPWYIASLVGLMSIGMAVAIDKKYLTEKIVDGAIQAQKPRAITSESTVQISEELIHKQNLSQESQSTQEEQFSCKRIFNLSSQFWVLCGAIFFFQAALGPFFDNMNDMIVKRFGISYTDAGKMLIIPEALLVVFGFGLAKAFESNPKRRRNVLLFGSISYFVFISILYLLPNTEEPTAVYYVLICIYLLLMSMMFACEYLLVGCTSYFVPKSQLGTAYGIAATALCACQCLAPLVNSAILDLYSQLDKSYEALSLFGAGLAIFPVIFALWMYQKEFQILDYNLKDQFVQRKLRSKSK